MRGRAEREQGEKGRMKMRKVTVEIPQIVFLGQDEENSIVSVSATRMNLLYRREGRRVMKRQRRQEMENAGGGGGGAGKIERQRRNVEKGDRMEII